MSGKWPGGFIKKTAPVVVGPVDGEGGTASGIWTLDQAADYEKQGLWPKPLVYRELWGIGGNESYGQLGILNGNFNVSSPVQVGTLTTWLRSAAGYHHSIFTKSDGTMWGVGRNTNGQLAQGNTTLYTSPVQVGALTTWSKISSGSYFSAATKTDGTLWAWGLGTTGQLGQGNTTTTSSPVQVGALTDWGTSLSVGSYGWMAVKTDGTLWGCGSNTVGALGQGNTTNYSSPVQVGALTDWAEVAFLGDSALAVKTDGTLWGIGENNNGQLADGTVTNRSSPVQVGALTTWSTIGCGVAAGYGVKTDGTLWSGASVSGQLGLGNTTYYSSPVQVGALTTWTRVKGGYKWAAGVRTDGKLFTWGDNFVGALGQGNTTDYSSPVQVGALTTWLKAETGPNSYGLFGFKSP